MEFHALTDIFALYTWQNMTLFYVYMLSILSIAEKAFSFFFFGGNISG